MGGIRAGLQTGVPDDRFSSVGWKTGCGVDLQTRGLRRQAFVVGVETRAFTAFALINARELFVPGVAMAALVAALRHRRNSPQHARQRHRHQQNRRPRHKRPRKQRLARQRSHIGKHAHRCQVNLCPARQCPLRVRKQPPPEPHKRHNEEKLKRHRCVVCSLDGRLVQSHRLRQCGAKECGDPHNRNTPNGKSESQR